MSCLSISTFLCVCLISLSLTHSLVEARHSRHCGERILQALAKLCSAFKRPSNYQLETGIRPRGGKGIVHHCCHHPCSDDYLRTYCSNKMVRSWYNI